MIEFGKTLRNAREAKGYNISQLSEMTRVLPHILEQLEREDFSKIVAPIYGRGFVKLYCEAVGLDPKPLVEAFMVLYNGEPSEEAADDGTARAEPEPPCEQDEPPIIPETPADPEPVREVPSVREPPAYELPGLGQDDVPQRDYRLPTYAVAEVPGSFWRFGILIVGALLVIAGLVFAGRAIYRATMTAPATSAEDAAVPDATDNRSIPRQPGAIPPLYID